MNWFGLFMCSLCSFFILAELVEINEMVMILLAADVDETATRRRRGSVDWRTENV